MGKQLDQLQLPVLARPVTWGQISHRRNRLQQRGRASYSCTSAASGDHPGLRPQDLLTQTDDSQVLRAEIRSLIPAATGFAKCRALVVKNECSAMGITALCGAKGQKGQVCAERRRRNLSLAVAEGEESGTENSEEAVEDAVGDVDADVASSLAELDAERHEELVADRVLAVCGAAKG